MAKQIRFTSPEFQTINTASIPQRSLIAQRMFEQGISGAPVGHLTQGLNRLAQGLLGGYELGQIRQEQKAEAERQRAAEKAASENIAKALEMRREPGPEFQGPVQPMPKDLQYFAPSDQERLLELSGTQFRLPQSPDILRAPKYSEIMQVLAQNPTNQALALSMALKQAEPPTQYQQSQLGLQGRGLDVQASGQRLTAETARRGQDINATIAANANALKKEEGRLNRENRIAAALAGKPETTITNKVDTAGETQEAKNLADIDTKIYDEAKSEAKAAEDANINLNAIKGVFAEGFTPGPGTDIKAKIGEIAGAFGIRTQNLDQFIGNVQKFNNIAMDNLLVELRKQKGPQTEGDAERARKTFPGADNTEDSAAYIIQLKTAINNKKIAKGEFMDEYRNLTGRVKGADAAWRSSPLNKSVFDDPVWKMDLRPSTLQQKKKAALENLKNLVGGQ